MVVEHLRFAWRLLVKQPVFSLTAILTLALAIGANTAVFTVVDAVLLKPLPYPQPERLALVSRVYRGAGIADYDVSHDGAVWEALRDHARTLELAALSDTVAQVTLVAGDRPRAVRQQRVSAGYFAVLGVSPALGREFTADEDRPNGPAAAVLSERLWRSGFAADPAVLGRRVWLRGEPVTIVGVMPGAFRGLADADVWTPLQPRAAGEGGGANYTLLARLRPEAAWAQASAEVAALADPLHGRAATATRPAVTHGLAPLQDARTKAVRRPLTYLAGAVLLVLLVACVNLAGLLLARGGRRTREIATRLAIGGDRRAVVGQLLVESALVAAIGGVLGLAVGALGLEALKALATDAFADWQGVTLDARAVAVTAGLTMLTALAFGLVPALQASRLDVQAALAEGGTRAIAGGTRGWPRRLLIVGEVALGVMLLVGAGLLIRSFAHLQGLVPGFDGTNVIAASASLQDARYQTPAAVARLFDESLARIRALPGVDAAAVSLGLPYERILNLPLHPLDRPDEIRVTSAAYVTPGYFQALRIPLEQGRPFTAADQATAPPVMVVNQAFVRLFAGDRDPLGTAVALMGATRQIVGIVGDVQQRGGFDGYGPVAALPIAYIPAAQFDAMALAHVWFAPNWLVRTAGGLDATERAVRAAIEASDPQLAVAEIRRLHDVQRASLAEERLLMTLALVLAAAAVLLTAIGIHGLIASAVAERQRELGIRLALGSTAAQAMRTVMLPGIALTMAGLGLGSILALGGAGLLRRLIWGVTPTDPLTFAGVALLLALVAIAASLVPALRVRRLDPAALLRE